MLMNRILAVVIAVVSLWSMAAPSSAEESSPATASATQYTHPPELEEFGKLYAEKFLPNALPNPGDRVEYKGVRDGFMRFELFHNGQSEGEWFNASAEGVKLIIDHTPGGALTFEAT